MGGAPAHTPRSVLFYGPAGPVHVALRLMSAGSRGSESCASAASFDTTMNGVPTTTIYTIVPDVGVSPIHGSTVSYITLLVEVQV